MQCFFIIYTPKEPIVMYVYSGSYQLNNLKKRVVHQLTKVKITMGKNIALIFHRNMLHSGGESTLHGFTTQQSPKFFVKFKKVKTTRTSRNTPKLEDNFCLDELCSESCKVCQQKEHTMFLNIQLLDLPFSVIQVSISACYSWRFLQLVQKRSKVLISIIIIIIQEIFIVILGLRQKMFYP